MPGFFFSMYKAISMLGFNDYTAVGSKLLLLICIFLSEAQQNIEGLIDMVHVDI